MKTVQSELQPAQLFTADTAKEVALDLQSLDAAFVSVRLSTLGDPTKPTLMLTVSLDRKDKWPHGYLENSRYTRFMIKTDGTVEQFSGTLPKFRKRRVKTIPVLLAELNKYLNSQKVPT